MNSLKRHILIGIELSPSKLSSCSQRWRNSQAPEFRLHHTPVDEAVYRDHTISNRELFNFLRSGNPNRRTGCIVYRNYAHFAASSRYYIPPQPPSTIEFLGTALLSTSGSGQKNAKRCNIKSGKCRLCFIQKNFILLDFIVHSIRLFMKVPNFSLSLHILKSFWF